MDVCQKLSWYVFSDKVEEAGWLVRWLWWNGKLMFQMQSVIDYGVELKLHFFVDSKLETWEFKLFGLCFKEGRFASEPAITWIIGSEFILRDP